MIAKSIQTYADLLDFLKGLNEDQLKQNVQVCPYFNDDTAIVGLQPVYLAGDVEGFELYGSRSSVDNKCNPHEIILGVDVNPFSEDGCLFVEWIETMPGVAETVRTYIGGKPTEKEEQILKTVLERK